MTEPTGTESSGPAPSQLDRSFALRLAAGRPVPTPEFVERLRVLRDAMRPPDRFLIAKIAGFAITGVVLLLIAAAITFL